MHEAFYEVVIVGYGPGAQALAALLGRMGHSVICFERYPGLFNLPRAGHIDHETIRMVQAVGDPEALLETLWPTTGEYVWLNQHGDQLMVQPALDSSVSSASGYYSDFTQWQPNLEAAFDAAATDAGVVVELGCEVVAVTERDSFVEVLANRVTLGEDGRPYRGEEYLRVRGRYVVGADGAGSFVRATLGIPREDLGFNERWLVVDMLTLDQSFEFHPNIAQICDPARPRMLMPLGRAHRRFEWMLFPDETVAEMEKPETAWRLLEEFGVTPETHEIARDIVYTFQARIAERWRAGRVLLSGDAAHTMPPFAGQGLLSSLRDSNNLAWKLDLVLRGLAPESLLDSYEPERRPHVRWWTELSIHEGEISCQVDPEKAAARDAHMLSGEPLPDFVQPILTGGILHRGDGGEPIAPAGELGLQRRVVYQGTEGRFDDVLGASRFSLITYGGDARQFLDPRLLEHLEALGAIVVEVVGTDAPPEPEQIVDIDGEYIPYLERHGLAAVLNRPDFYVFGGVPALDDLDGLVGELIRYLEGDSGQGAGSLATGSLPGGAVATGSLAGGARVS
jgi:2-polyprenyl-6-methoxyphenol hydroxylase-like FAD-dependent oxidoreductase